MKKMICLAIAVGALVPAYANWFSASEKDTAGSQLMRPPRVSIQKDRDGKGKAKAALMYINHLNHVIAKLGNMDDLMILQQEYENLTDDNLNLETIQDETTVELVLQLMEQLKNLQQSKVGSIQAQIAYEKEKDGAIWKALPQPAIFLVPRDPWSMALAVGGAALTSVQNYYNACAQADLKKDEKDFSIGKDKLSYINEINKELFVAQWRLMRDYGIEDRERVTREDSRLFLGFASVLKNGGERADHHRSQLVYDIFKAHDKEMRNLPFYWITRASAANALKDKEDLKLCCEQYFNLYKDAPIVRRDMDACAMALLYVGTSLRSILKDSAVVCETDKEVIREWLQFILDTVRIPEWETKFTVAQIYRQIGDDVKAKEVLQTTLSEVCACIRVWEDSNHTDNIFRKTPALEKAYGFVKDKDRGDAEWKSAFGDWQKNSALMVPYRGFVWITGALAEMGVEKGFDRLPCKVSEFGVSGDYIERKNIGKLPLVSCAGSKINIRSNGLWENGSVVRVFVDGKECRSVDSSGTLFENEGSGRGNVLVVSVQTRFGIALNFKYNMKDMSGKPKTGIKYPWSLK